MSGKVQHLLERSGRYHARLSVPKPLRLIVGQTELLKPLGADLREAKRQLPGAVATMQATLEAARAQLSKQPKKMPAGRKLTPSQMARAHYEAQVAFDEQIRNSDPRYANMGIDEEYVEALRRATTGAASNAELKGTVGAIIKKFRQLRHTAVLDDTPEWRELSRVLAGAELEYQARVAERDEGDFSGTPSLPALTTEKPLAIDAQSARALQPDSMQPLSALVDAFTGERKASESTNRETVIAVGMLEEVMGEARPLYKITRQDIHALKKTLSDLPSNYKKRFPDHTMTEAIKANKARNQPFAVLHPITINDKWLARIHTILGWCVRNDLIPDNPASGIKVERANTNDDNENDKYFRPNDLGKLFGDKFYDDAEKLGERQWAMLIALFGGLRASEIAQLKLDSIRTERKILIMAVEEKTKNKGSRRIVPVHTKLIELGLKKRVDTLRRSGETHLFPEWYAKGMEAKRESRAKGGTTLNHYFPRFIPKRFNDTYLPSVGIHDEWKSFHTFRHTFKSGLKRAGVVKSMRDELAGHSDSSAGAIYEHEGSVEAMREAIEKLEFDGFELR